MLHVSRYHSGSLKVRAASRFNFSNFHTAFRTKNRRRRPVASVPTSSLPHRMQVLRSFRPFLIKRRRVPTLPASTMVKECAAYDEGAGFSLGRRKNDILISKTGRPLKELSPDADLKVVKRSRRSLCRVLRAGKRRSH